MQIITNEGRGIENNKKKKKTDHESQHRRNKIAEFLCFFMQIITNEGRGIHTHKSDQSPEIEQIGPKIIACGRSSQGGKQKCAGQRENAYKKNIIAWHSPLGIDCAEERFW